MNRRNFQTALAGIIAGGFAPFASGAGKPRRPQRMPNWQTPTAGGQQLWGDVRYHAGYRIQRHALTGHHRLLNPKYERIAWGSLDACEANLADVRQREPLLLNSETAVVFLHGLFRTRWSMWRIGQSVAEQTGWQSIVLGYPSTRGSVSDHASMLDEAITHLDGVRKLYFVAHSLGNLVVRRWFHDLRQDKAANQRDLEVKRMVMIGPPNHRPALARTLVPIDRHKLIAGAAGDDLNGNWKQLAPTLATPPCEFGILAGGLGNDSGHNPLIPGDDDMIVGVDETRLAGAHDFRVLNVIHATMMYVPEIHKMTVQFLKNGYFETPDARTPLKQS